MFLYKIVLLIQFVTGFEMSHFFDGEASSFKQTDNIFLISEIPYPGESLEEESKGDDSSYNPDGDEVVAQPHKKQRER